MSSMEDDVKLLKLQAIARAIPARAYQEIFPELNPSDQNVLIERGLGILEHYVLIQEEWYGSSSPQYWRAVRALAQLQS